MNTKKMQFLITRARRDAEGLEGYLHSYDIDLEILTETARDLTAVETVNPGDDKSRVYVKANAGRGIILWKWDSLATSETPEEYLERHATLIEELDGVIVSIPSSQTKPKLWTPGKIAEAIGVTDRQVLNYIHGGQINAQKVGTTWIINHDEALRFLAERLEQLVKEKIRTV